MFPDYDEGELLRFGVFPDCDEGELLRFGVFPGSMMRES